MFLFVIDTGCHNVLPNTISNAIFSLWIGEPNFIMIKYIQIIIKQTICFLKVKTLINVSLDKAAYDVQQILTKHIII